jgi:hypothetical protein
MLRQQRTRNASNWNCDSSVLHADGQLPFQFSSVRLMWVVPSSWTDIQPAALPEAAAELERDGEVGPHGDEVNPGADPPSGCLATPETRAYLAENGVELP